MWKWLASVKRRAVVRKGIFVFTFLAVIAPTISLLVLQYRSFQNLRPRNWDVIEREMQNELFQVKARLGDCIISTFTALFLEMRRFQGTDIRLWKEEKIRQSFIDLRSGHPEIGRVFVYRVFRSGFPQVRKEQFIIGDETDFRVIDLKGAYPASILTISSETGAETAADEDLIMSTFAALNRGPIHPFRPSSLFQPASQDRYEKVHFWQGDCLKCSEERKGDLNYAVVEAPVGSAERCVIGLTFKSDYLKRRLFEQVRQSVQEAAFERGKLSEFGIQLVDLGAKHTTGISGAYEQKTFLDPIFPRWALVAAASQSGAFDEASRRYFLQSFTLSILTVIFLVLGMLIAVRVTVREAKLVQEKSDFVSNVSHELKTPLALIRMFAETLELGRVRDQAKAQEYYRIIVAESQRLTRLINNILDFSAIESGRRKYDFIVCDPAEIVAEVVESYRHAIVVAGFAFNVELADRIPLASVDPQAFAQVLINLLNNAVKYSNAVKEISVRAYGCSGGVAIEVTDRGIGIPYAEQEKIFEKFYRVGNSLIHNVKGSGLGLSLVKHIVEAHGGEIKVASAPNVGSCFTVFLPAIPESNYDAETWRNS